MPGCLLGWARLGQARVASLGRSWVVLGGLGWSSGGSRAVLHAAAAGQLPITSTFYEVNGFPVPFFATANASKRGKRID